MVVQPALKRPRMPSAETADLMTAPQKGATSSVQSADSMFCKVKGFTENICRCPRLVILVETGFAGLQ